MNIIAYKAKHPMCRLSGVALILLASLTTAQRAQAAFHLWNIHELYTNSTGTLQFIEFQTSFGSQQFVGNLQVQVSNVGNSQSHSFTIPMNLPGDTTNKFFLIGTIGLHAAGGPTPDYTMPDGFLFSGGGTINFFGANSGPYAALPTDGTLSRTFGDGTAVNSPENFAGQIGRVVVAPEPSAVALLGAAAACGLAWRSLRRKTG